jgi:hypothetical protein
VRELLELRPQTMLETALHVCLRPNQIPKCSGLQRKPSSLGGAM